MDGIALGSVMASRDRSAKIKRVADPLQWRYEAHMGAERRMHENVLQFPRFSKKYRKEILLTFLVQSVYVHM